MKGDFYHIIDLGPEYPSHCRYAIGTAEPDPFGGPGRWIRIRTCDVRPHHLPIISTGSDDDIIEATDLDEVTG